MSRRSRTSRRAVLVGLALASTAACGTTVRQATVLHASSDQGTSQLSAGSSTGGDSSGTTSTGDASTGSTGSDSSGTTGSSDPTTTTTGGTSGTTGSTGTTGTATTGRTTSSKAPTKASTAPTKGAATSAAKPTGAKVTASLTVGFLTTATSNSSQYGASQGNTLDETKVDTALVNAINKAGGLDGRKLIPVFAKTDTGSSSWDSDFQAACATFTQDNHVAAVLGYQFTYEPTFESCLAQKGIPHLETGFNVPDNTELKQYPLHRALMTPTIEERQLAKIDGAIATGALTPSSKLAVALDSCPGTQRSYDAVTKPYLDAHHINVVYSANLGCPDGASAAAGEVGQIPNIILQMRSKGVDHIMFASTSEGPALLLVSVTADSQGWKPTYVVSSLANLAVLGSQAPADQMANVKGFGWIPNQDVSPSQYPPLDANAQRCVALLKSQGLTLSAAADYGYAFNVCEAVFVYEAALKATNGDSTGTKVVAAVDSLGTSYQSVSNLDGKTVLSPARVNNAPDSVRPIVWQTSCSCFGYTGTARPLAFP